MFKSKASDLAEEYGGEAAGDFVEAAIDKVVADENLSEIVPQLSSNQESGLSSLFSLIGGSAGGMESKARDKGLDPSLISGLMSMIDGGGSGASGGGGFDISKLMSVASMLTKGGSEGKGGGAGGFMGLLEGLSGGSGSSNNIITILVGLATSYFSMQRAKNPALQDWGQANPGSSETSGDSIKGWAGKLIMDLLFPGKKSKELLDGGSADDDSDKSTDRSGIKGWYDGHPEIGKMQKDVFDDVLDIGGDDEEDDIPLVPTPTGFTEDCSVLDEAMVMFLNTNVLLELRKNWRFLYSTKTNSKDFKSFCNAIVFKGPTIIVVKTSGGQMVGAFSSTSWRDTDGGWVGNGDSFVFSLKPKMAIFYSTGKDENFMSFSKDNGLGLGGRTGRFGLGIEPNLLQGTYHEDVETFDLPASALPNGDFEIEHVEAWGLGPEVDPSEEQSKSDIRKPNLQISGGQVDMNDLLSQMC